jgi:hypothetical protein
MGATDIKTLTVTVDAGPPITAHMGGHQLYAAAILNSSMDSDTGAVQGRDLTNGDTFGDTRRITTHQETAETVESQ